MTRTRLPRDVLFKSRALHDDVVMLRLRELLAEAQGRPAIQPALRRLLAGVLAEIKGEMMIGSTLTADEIADTMLKDEARMAEPAPMAARVASVRAGRH